MKMIITHVYTLHDLYVSIYMYMKRETNWSIRTGPSWDEDTSEDNQPQSQTAQKTFYTYTYMHTILSTLPTKEIEPKHSFIHSFIQFCDQVGMFPSFHTSLQVISQLT